MAGSGELFKNEDGKWSFRVLTTKGDVVAVNGGSGFSSLAGAQATLAKLLKGWLQRPHQERGHADVRSRDHPGHQARG